MPTDIASLRRDQPFLDIAVSTAFFTANKMDSLSIE